MKDIIDAIKSRISSPVLGYFSMALVAINWKSFFYLFVDNGDVIKRIEYFESTSSLMSIIVYPLLVALSFLVLNKWLTLLVEALNTIPSDMINNLYITSEHKQLVLKRSLEEERNRIYVMYEKNVVDRAKIDEEIHEIQNVDVREKAKQEIDKIRGGDIMSATGTVSNGRHEVLMGQAAEYRKRAENSDINDKNGLIKKAIELESKAHSILMNSPEF